MTEYLIFEFNDNKNNNKSFIRKKYISKILQLRIISNQEYKYLQISDNRKLKRLKLYLHSK